MGRSPETASSSLGTMLGLGHVTGNEMPGMLDWLLSRQPWIERSLARRHLTGGTLILYDLSSSYLEGRRCPPAGSGHSRDGRRGKAQINFGLLCAAGGCPVAVEVFPETRLTRTPSPGRSERSAPASASGASPSSATGAC